MRFDTWNMQCLRTKPVEVFQEIDRERMDVCTLIETKKKSKSNEIV